MAKSVTYSGWDVLRDLAVVLSLLVAFIASLLATDGAEAPFQPAAWRIAEAQDLVSCIHRTVVQMPI